MDLRGESEGLKELMHRTGNLMAEKSANPCFETREKGGRVKSYLVTKEEVKGCLVGEEGGKKKEIGGPD